MAAAPLMMDSRKMQQKMMAYGPDSAYSWLTAFACGMVNLFMYASSKVFGIVFLGLIESYGASREEAAWPISLNTAVINLAGPVFGYLSRFLAIRNIILSCTALSSVALSLCFFVPDIFFMSIAFGIVHGAATCGAILLTQIIINQHFFETRASASNTVAAISSLNSIIFPPLFEYWRTCFSFQSALLLMGAVLLNSTAFAFLIRSPKWLASDPNVWKRRRKSYFRALATPKRSKKVIVEISSTDSSEEEEECSRSLQFANSIRYYAFEGENLETLQNKKSLNLPLTDANRAASLDILQNNNKINEIKSLTETKSEVILNEDKVGSQYIVDLLPTKSISEPLKKSDKSHDSLTFAVIPILGIPTGYTVVDPLERVPSDDGKPYKSTTYQVRKLSRASTTSGPGTLEVPGESKIRKFLRKYLSLPFCHLTFSQFVVIFGMGTFLMTIIDFANDNNIRSNRAVYLISSFSVGDLIARCTTGVLTEKGYVRMESVMATAFIVQGLCYESLCYLKEYGALIVLTIGLGISHGSRVSLIPVLLSKSIGLKKLSVSLSISTCTCGLLMLSRPFIIGYFRDRQGAYEGLYHLVCVVNIVFAITWLFKLHFVKKQEKKLAKRFYY